MKKILVVANQTAVGAHLTQRVYEMKEAEPEIEVMVVVPATPRSGSRTDIVGRPVHDHDGVERAGRQLSGAISALEKIGVTGTGWVGPADPMACVRSALSDRSFNHIIVSTLPVGVSRWVAMDLPHRIERRFNLPVDHIVGQAVDEQVSPEPIEGPVRVLLVEDQPADIALSQQVFENDVHEIDVRVAKNGAEALDALRTYGPESVDIVLLDLKMPVLDGHEFLARASEEFELDRLNVVVLTTSSSDNDRERAHALGVGAYIIKDPDFEVFQASLASVVSEVAAGR